MAAAKLCVLAAVVVLCNASAASETKVAPDEATASDILEKLGLLESHLSVEKKQADLEEAHVAKVTKLPAAEAESVDTFSKWGSLDEEKQMKASAMSTVEKVPVEKTVSVKAKQATEVSSGFSVVKEAKKAQPLKADLAVQQRGLVQHSSKSRHATLKPMVDAIAGASAGADMESTLTDLVMGKGAFMATPMGSSVKKIKDTIEKNMMPAVFDAHKADQAELVKLASQLANCGGARKVSFRGVHTQKVKYLKSSPLHKACRSDEAVKHTAKTSCLKEQGELKQIKRLKCKFYADTSKRVGDTNANRAIVTRAGGEAVQTYVTRVTATICGKPGGKGKGGGGKGGQLDDLMNARAACEKATGLYRAKVKKCNHLIRQYTNTKAKCNQIQNMMDGAACKRAVLTKDMCETYAECYKSKLEAYGVARSTIIHEEKDRKAEWRGLKRMACLIGCFMDGKVKDGEVNACKKSTHNTNHLIIKYPKLAKFRSCEVPKAYPATPLYKKLQFAPLPVNAKGRQSEECTGVLEISTVPKKGSPKACKCERVTLNGPYGPGPMVKCRNCRDVRRSRDKNSCPEGTKIFSPRSRTDWQTFIASAQPLRQPHFIIDITRPQNGCGGCTGNPMNSGNKKQKSWTTADKSPWWLRSTKYSEPNGDYHANCYLDLWHTPKHPDKITWNDGSCGYHSKSYYCQPKHISTTPKKGSPKSCACTKVALTGSYKPGTLLRCSECLDVRRTQQKNSCPIGTKIFAPTSRADWSTFVKSAAPLRAPHWIIDVTRPSNGCGGCTRHPMNSKVMHQATWRTSDGAPWWLRSSRYSEPNGDYSANCYMDLWRTPSNENAVTFNDGRCNYHSRSYYCQSTKPRRKKSKRR